MYAAHKHTDLRPDRPRRLMMVTPDNLTTNHSEERPRADHTPATLSLTLSSKTPPRKPSGSSGLLSISCLDSLLGARTKRCTLLPHSPVSVGWLCCVRVMGPKFGSVAPRTSVWSRSQQGRAGGQRSQAGGESRREGDGGGESGGHVLGG